MNAAVGLIERVLPSTAHVQAKIPEAHASSRILGTERMGSGTIVDAGGLILTVNYVVLGAEEVKVTLLDQRAYIAEVVRADFASGLALVRIPEERLPALPLRRTDDLTLGEEVFIVGSVGEGSARIANGAVSYIGPFDANWEYVLDRAIMTTAMNPGLGGGPLLDVRGRVVGVVSLNLNEIGRFSLVIPADYYLEGRDAFLAGRPLPATTRAWLGIFCYAVKDHVVIAGLLPGGPGEQAGLKSGDVVLAVDGQDVGDRRSLYRLLWSHRPGEPVTLKIFRGRQLHTVTVAAGDVEKFFE
ncbi:MAG TPA: S1C family serine protease [Candidatus Binatia bacterium]|nr:S1C family serine protease [Candidatus Binatia bacterium]